MSQIPGGCGLLYSAYAASAKGAGLVLAATPLMMPVKASWQLLDVGNVTACYLLCCGDFLGVRVLFVF